MSTERVSTDFNTKLAKGLSSVLADSYVLYLKTQNFHWNVTGPRFHQLHTMFEEHYTELATAIDEIAERIRVFDERTPGSFKEFLALTSIEEETSMLEADEMIKQLAKDHEAVSRKAREVISIASEQGDEATADLLTGRITTHDKTAWMLRSFLQ